MQEVTFLAWTSIDEATRELVEKAPAVGTFNGVRPRARYATTRPTDIARQFRHELDNRRVVWANSLEGKAAAARRAEEITNNQAIVDWHIELLPRLDCTNSREVLNWLGGIVNAADDSGVLYDRGAVIEHFKSCGWEPGANCKPNFNENDPRNFAGWIVGQWLETKHPMVIGFIEQWRQKFDGA